MAQYTNTFMRQLLAGSTLIITLFSSIFPGGNVFASSGLEFLPYADTLGQAGVIKYQSDSSQYKLGESITRAEMVKIAMRLRSNQFSACQENIYKDVNGTLRDLCGYVETAANAGIISAKISTFRPSDDVSRAELVKMLLASVGANPSSKSAGFTDVPTSMGDLAGYINRATELGCIDPSKYFQPNNAASRGESFKIAACVMKIHASGKITESKIVSIYTNTFNTTSSAAGDTVYNSASNQDIITNATDATTSLAPTKNPYGPYVATPISQVQYALGSTQGSTTTVYNNGTVNGNQTVSGNSTIGGNIVAGGTITANTGAFTNVTVSGGTGTATTLLGRDGSGQLNGVVLGANLTLSGGILSAIGGSGTFSGTTDAITEGIANLYFTLARFTAAFNSMFGGAFDTAFSGKTTDDLAEGTGSLYFTNARADARVNTLFG